MNAETKLTEAQVAEAWAKSRGYDCTVFEWGELGGESRKRFVDFANRIAALSSPVDLDAVRREAAYAALVEVAVKIVRETSITSVHEASEFIDRLRESKYGAYATAASQWDAAVVMAARYFQTTIHRPDDREADLAREYPARDRVVTNNLSWHDAGWKKCHLADETGLVVGYLDDETAYYPLGIRLGRYITAEQARAAMLLAASRVGDQP